MADDKLQKIQSPLNMYMTHLLPSAAQSQLTEIHWLICDAVVVPAAEYNRENYLWVTE